MEIQSITLEITSGVPQGSILGPILFLIYINDFPRNLPNINTVMYADDCSLHMSCPSDETLITSMNRSLECASQWFTNNGLSLNTQKTHFLQFSLCNNPVNNLLQKIHINSYYLESPESVKFLGIFLDANLSWDAHINHICKRIRPICYGLYRLAGICSQDALLSVYYAHVESILRYGIIFWGMSKAAHFDRVFKIQKWCIRSLSKLTRTQSCKPIFKEYRILTLAGLFCYESCLYVKNNKDNFKRNSSFHDYGTRNRNQLAVMRHNTSAFERGPYHSCMSIFNKLPKTLREESRMHVFKKQLKLYFVEKCLYSFNFQEGIG